MNQEKLSPQQVQSMLTEGKPVLFLDVRDVEKYEAGSLHVEGRETHNIAYVAMRDNDKEALDRIDRLPQNVQIITVCTTGNKAGKAAQLLRERGRNAVSLEGGMTAWNECVESKK